MKQIFKITEPLEQIYFQDEDGDILIINENIPSGISIHLFVEPDSIPKNPSKELKVKDKKEELIKFHWIIEKSYNSDKLTNVIINKYLYTTVNDDDTHPFVRSSCTFEKGVHFFVLRKPRLDAYTFICINDENKTDNEIYKDAIGIINGYPRNDNELYNSNLGILIDMEHKKCIFYDYDKKAKIKIQYTQNLIDETDTEGYEAPILFEKVKLVAWLKRHACNIDRKGITILNEGCIPIPDWVK